MIVKVTYSDITDKEQKVLFDEFGYIIALMWRDYLLKGGDSNIFNNK